MRMSAPKTGHFLKLFLGVAWRNVHQERGHVWSLENKRGAELPLAKCRPCDTCSPMQARVCIRAQCECAVPPHRSNPPASQVGGVNVPRSQTDATRIFLPAIFLQLFSLWRSFVP